MAIAAPSAPPAAARVLPTPLAFWQAPLVPIALAVSAGIVFDRYFNIPSTLSLVAGLACVLAFLLHGRGSQRLLALLYLWCGCAAAGAAFHHAYCNYVAADDVRHFLGDAGRPAQLRGVIESPPAFVKESGIDPLRSFPKKAATRFSIQVSAIQDPADRTWQPASGLVQVHVSAPVAGLAVGDSVEMPGRLSLPEPADNPGEFDYSAYCRDRGIAALLSVREPDQIQRLERGLPWLPSRWRLRVRGWGQDVLTGAIAEPQGDLAAALLLGDSPGMTQDDWDVYLRTGVIHVLAISGQHFVVLAGFLWLLLRVARVGRRRGAPLVALLLLVYAQVVGGRPPVMRPAWMMLAYSGGTLLRRPTHPANTFALAWLGVALLNPTDLFNAGCQLSFLAVAVLVWGIPTFEREPDPLQDVVDSSRPRSMTLLADAARGIAIAYGVNLLVWLAVAPLVASRFNLVSPIALLIGPPLVLLTSIALLTGFGVLLLAPIAAPLTWPFAFATRWSLAGCAYLTDLGARLPGAYFYVPDVPAWWLWLFYALLLVGLVSGLVRRRWRLAYGGTLATLGVGLLALLWSPAPGEFRCSFLAVGHGGCVVVETPAGRVFIYDAGSIAGPDLTRRVIAPFLWRRGVHRIDEVIFSHADLDHFNGLPELLKRFTVGRVTCTPTFDQRDLPAIRVVMADIERRRIPVRVVSAGDRWEADDIAFEVMHPPIDGPDGKENVRSLVLHLRYRDVTLLLTGDLEDAGLEQLLARAPRNVDVLMAPHHGGARSSTPQLAAWADPRLVVMCQGRSDDTRAAARVFDATRSTVYGTWPHGAVTVRADAAGAWVETFRTRKRWALTHGEP